MAFWSIASSKAEVYRFRWFVILAVSLLALVLQTFLPLYLIFFTVLDLPLLVVIYFSLARRSPVPSLLGGALIGMAQDSLTRGPIGLFAAVKTVIGYVTSAVSVHFDTESIAVRFLTIFILYEIHFLLLYLLGAVLLGQTMEFQAETKAFAALVNAGLGVLLFQVLDRFREPA